MAIATATAIALGTAALTAGATAYGASKSAKATKSAANQASQTASSTAASNNALARENRDFGFNVLSPFRNTGMQAQNVLSGLLYGSPTSSALPGQSTTQYGAPQMVNESQFLNPGGAPMGGQMTEEWANGALNRMGLGSRGNSVDTLQRHLRGELEGPLSEQMMGAYQSYQNTTPMQTPALAHAPAGQMAVTVPAKSAWDQFRDSTNYQFRYNEGMKGLNLGLANQGYQGSGMAVKEAIKFGQNFGSNELNNYIGLLTGQQNVGLSAGSAMVGVSNNATNNVMANNTMAGQTAANAGLVGAQAQGQMWGDIAKAAGTFAGSVGSSYKAPGSTTAPYTGVGGDLFKMPGT